MHACTMHAGMNLSPAAQARVPAVLHSETTTGLEDDTCNE
jgi:hypothetical protein